MRWPSKIWELWPWWQPVGWTLAAAAWAALAAGGAAGPGAAGTSATPAASVGAVASLVPPGGPAAGCGWMQPVDAPVIDPFRPPEHPYGPGNRGLEYGVEVGQRVGAVAAGQVSFAGPVGGRHYAVVDHGAGLRSTYGPLVGSAVVRGQRLSAGEEIGGADAGFHLTARRGDRYVDPAPLLAGDCGHARLVSPPEVPAATSLGVVAPLGAPR